MRKITACILNKEKSNNLDTMLVFCNSEKHYYKDFGLFEGKKSKMNKEYPTVLVLSHTSFTSSDSMGSTMASYFTTYQPENVFQFYIKEMTPDIPVCFHYYKITDNDLVKKIFRPFSYQVGSELTISNTTEKDGMGKAAEASAIGNHRHRDFTLLLRKLLWKTRLWDNKRFRKWLNTVSPDIILVQPGDFSYLLDLAVELSMKRNIPLMVHQSEAYYLKEYEKKTLIYKLFRRDYKKSYERMMDRASMCVYLCDALKRDYDKFFSKNSCTIMKSTNCVSTYRSGSIDRKNVRFIYGGNLGETVGRCEPLVEVGKAVKSLGFYIDVYTASRGEYMKTLTPENGILLHGAIPYTELQNKIAASDFILHVESQRPWNVKDLKYAFTTKIADMLASGCCSIVYGSSEIGSIQYFKENQLGCVIEDKADLKERISALIQDDRLRNSYINNAITQAKKFHNPEINANQMRKIILDICAWKDGR